MAKRRRPGGANEEGARLTTPPWKLLPQLLGDERHDGMQQTQRLVERVQQDRSRDLAGPRVLVVGAQTSLQGFQIPVGELVPHEAPRCFRVLVETKASESLV